MTAHHWIVAFPVTLLLLGAGADALGAATGREEVRRWATPLLVAGAGAALLAFFTGQGAMLMVQARHVAEGRLDAHSQWGGAAVWPLAVAGGLRLAWRRRLSGTHGWVLLAAALASAVLVVLIARTGLALAHGG